MSLDALVRALRGTFTPIPARNLYEATSALTNLGPGQLIGALVDIALPKPDGPDGGPSDPADYDADDVDVIIDPDERRKQCEDKCHAIYAAEAAVCAVKRTRRQRERCFKSAMDRYAQCLANCGQIAHDEDPGEIARYTWPLLHHSPDQATMLQ